MDIHAHERSCSTVSNMIIGVVECNVSFSLHRLRQEINLVLTHLANRYAEAALLL